MTASAYIECLPDLAEGYCVIDTETTGLDPQRDRIIEISVLIKTGEDTPLVRTALLKSVDQVPAQITRITGISTEMLNKEGRPPEEIYNAILNMEEMQTLPIVGHNIVGFDRRFLLGEAQRLIGAVNYWQAESVLDQARIIDTGALYKGIRLGSPPKTGESHFDWAQRILEVRSPGLRWNLYTAASAYGLTVDREKLHRARADTIICQRLLERILKAQGG